MQTQMTPRALHMSMYKRVAQFTSIIQQVEQLEAMKREIDEQERKTRVEYNESEIKLLTQTEPEMFEMLKMLENPFYVNLMEQGMFMALEHLNNELMRIKLLREKADDLKGKYNSVVNDINTLHVQLQSLCYGGSKVENKLKDIYVQFINGKRFSEIVFDDDTI